ncbi:carbohydrate kinase family protein [Chloroflexus sp.]|uniref:carbohydrate kinase family protein n=1 Tax=Chloroflexus sp. TaxID=1904827 RepID=UPI004048F5E9
MSAVLCYGSLCADLRIWLPHWPQHGSGVHAVHTRWLAGGNALNEARALVSWGVRPLLYGDRLGYDAGGDLVVAELTALGLMTHVERSANIATPICHILITPDGERTIIALRQQTAASPPSAEVLATCRIVSVSRYGLYTTEVATTARQLNRLVVVGDVSDPADPMAQAADVIVTSVDRSGADPFQQAVALQQVRGAPVFVTDGPRPARVLVAGSWYEATPSSTESSDLTGAGDVFRAGVVYGIWKGWTWQEILAFATHAATTFVIEQSTA